MDITRQPAEFEREAPHKREEQPNHQQQESKNDQEAADPHILSIGSRRRV